MAAPSTSPPAGDADVIFPIVKQSQVDVIVVAAVFIFLPTLAVVLRVLARRIARRPLDSSDYCIIAACIVANTLQTVAVVGVVQCGVGYHFTDIIAEHGLGPITKFLKILIAVQFLWAISLSLCKISILLLYTKIFSVPFMIKAAYAMVGFIVAWALTTIFLGFFICRPFAFNWDQSIPGGVCGNQVTSYLATGALNLVTDIVVMLMPLSYLWKLQLKTYKKVALMATFSMGIFTVVISGMRLNSLTELDYSDITFNIPHALIFGSLEPSVGVILACIPLLRPLLARSQYSASGTARYHVSAENSISKPGPGNNKKDGFAPLHDDSSQYHLDPLGPGGKQQDEVAATSTSNRSIQGGRTSSELEEGRSHPGHAM
ncbi:integral membrane protein [Bombardia bombarda]|uniref:Integral membrane protein n=1 Tax=Bombardia bombarda TaxID=252184 RepID=A0AA39WLU2_9PEZI|nr:integral membrane protein [Bombardia bombarda]